MPGLVQYYLLAEDVWRLHRLHRLRWVMGTSMLKTLGAKHCSNVSKDDRGTVTSGSEAGRAEKAQVTLAPRRSAEPAGWLMLHHRRARDYETLPASSEAMIHLAMIDNVSKRKTDETTPTWRGTYYGERCEPSAL